MNKAITYIILISFIILNFLALSLFNVLIIANNYTIRQKLAKAESSIKLDTLVFSKDSPLLKTIKYIKKDEIYFDGKMYDIKHEIRTGDSIRIICINDAKEQELIKSFAGGASNSNLPLIVKNLRLLLFCGFDSERHFNNLPLISTSFRPEAPDRIILHFPRTIYHPPEIA